MLAHLRLSNVFSTRPSRSSRLMRPSRPATSKIPNLVPNSHKSLVIDARRGNSSLFPTELHSSAKLSSMCRFKRSTTRYHGSHGPHHSHHSFPLISGVHPDVDPRLFNQAASEDHDAGTKVTIYGIVMNIALSMGKGVAGVLGNSTAMIADAVHSMGDLGSDMVTLYTHKISARGPSPSYPYGYGRFDSLGGFVVSLLLVATGLGIGYHAALELFTASGEPPSSIALYAAAASVLVKEVLFQMTLKTATKLNSKVLIANAWHHRSDAISSGLAFVGIAGEMVGVPHMDALAGIAVSGIIIKAAAPVIRDSLDEITDRNDFIQVDKAIRDLAKSMSIDVDRLRIRKSGNHLIAEISVSVDPDQSSTFLKQTRDFKGQIRTQFPIIQDISVELQERGMEEFHPEHGEHPPGQGPDIQSAHERVQRESKDILPKVKMGSSTQ